MADKMLISKREIDKWYLYALVISLACGGIGAAAQPVRVLIVALAPMCLWDAIQNLGFRRRFRFEIVTLALWLMVAGFSMTKAVDSSESTKALIYLMINMIGYIEVLWLCTRIENPKKNLIRAWLLMLLVTVPIALAEFMLDVHLSSSVLDAGAQQKVADEYVERRFAAVTFGNLNSYNTILCFVLPFTILQSLQSTERRDRILGFVVLFLQIVMIFANSSRGALICLVFELFLFVAYYLKEGKGLFWLLAGGAVVVLVFVKYMLENFTLIIGRFMDQGLEDDGRIENIVKGLQALIDSNGMGIGVGNYTPIMSDYYNVRIPAPHNLYLEVLVTFGVIILLLFLVMHIRIWTKARHHRYEAILFLATILLTCFIDSTYLLKAPTWVLLASAIVCSADDFSPQSDMKSIESSKTTNQHIEC